MILIGIDPHKSSHTAVDVAASGHQLAQRRFVVNAGTFRQFMAWCESWPERRFAVEGAGGLGRSLARSPSSWPPPASTWSTCQPRSRPGPGTT